MFKKIEIWILFLVILLSILLVFGFGVLVRQELVGSIKAGWISKTALSIADIPANLKSSFNGLKEQDRFLNSGGFVGNPNEQESYLLLSRYNGDLSEGIVELIDLTNFQVLHTWNPNIDEFNSLIIQTDEFQYIDRDRNNSRSLLRHPQLTSDGGLLFKHTTPLRKIDACSGLIFQITKDLFHHSLEEDIDGNIWIPAHTYPQRLPSEKIGRNLPHNEGYLDDSIVKISPEGEILYENSVSQIFIDNELEYLLFSMRDKFFVRDPIHLNDIQPVDFDSQYWKKGDVFLSLRNQSMVLLYRPTTNKIIWKGTGKFFHQHDVNILDDHRIYVFNNNLKDFYEGDIVDGHNQVLIYNFKTNKYSSYLAESLIENDVRTPYQGRNKILPNGDLFLEETDYARTLYINADGSLRWSHLNRADDGFVYSVGWSRILYTQEDIQKVNNFLDLIGPCHE